MKCPAWSWPAFSDGAARFGPIGKSGRYRHLRASLQGEGLELSGKRHFAVSHNHSDRRQKKLLLIDPVLIPVGEVHMPAADVNIPFDQPGHRGNIAVPRPLRPFGMAVLTGSFCDGENAWIDV